MSHRMTLFAAALLGTTLSACNDKPPLGANEPGTAPTFDAPTQRTAKDWALPSTELPRNALCMVDAINGSTPTADETRVASGSPFSVEGWVSTSELGNPGSFQLIFLGDRGFQVDGRTGVVRNDVAMAYDSPALTDAGFALDLPGLGLPPGEYRLLLQHQGESSATLCDTNVVINVE